MFSIAYGKFFFGMVPWTTFWCSADLGCMYDGDYTEGLIPTPGNLGLQGMCLESPSG